MSRTQAFLDRPFAHRGLWSPGGPAENSLAAIEAAVTVGYGVEIDIRASFGGLPVVFHDDDLARMAGRDDLIEDLTLEALQAVGLMGGEDRVPTLEQALKAVGTKTPLLVEIKSQTDAGLLEEEVARLLDHHRGPAAVISFNADSLAWFAANRPDQPRGLDYGGASDQAIAESQFDLEGLFEGLVTHARPDFLVLSADMAGGRIAERHRKAGRPVIAWTVRSKAEADALVGKTDAIIFEGFTP